MQRVLQFAFPGILWLSQLQQASADSFEQTIRPLLRDYCVTCHSTEKQEGEFDLERFSTLAQVQQDAEVWERVQEQLALGEMPPEDAKQLSAEHQRQLADWVQQTLGDIALANAGDPGPVVLRRLMERADLAGGGVHDARIAAICLEHSVDELWTSDRDFARFPDLRIRDPLIPSIHEPVAQGYQSAAVHRRRAPPTVDRLRE